MPRWLRWWLGLFIGVNALGSIAGLPTPFVLLYEFFTKPAPAARTVDGGIRGLSLVMALGMLVGWLILAGILAAAMRERKDKGADALADTGPHQGDTNCSSAGD